MSETPFSNLKGQPIVYVREVARDDLPDELKDTNARLFALHDAAGNRIAVTPTRKVAFALAKRNDLVPLSVH